MSIEPTGEKPRRRTTWPAALPLQQAADTLRTAAPDITGRPACLADPVADWLDETANTLAWLAPYRENESGYDMWEQATRVASIINGTSVPGAPVAADQPDRCPACWCGDCGGRLDEHTEAGCGCDSCQPDPSLACSLAQFEPDPRVDLLAQQLAPLLSAHLNARSARRCLAVAHAAHHFLRDYDHPNGDPR